jgi:hypothetical protein
MRFAKNPDGGVILPSMMLQKYTEGEQLYTENNSPSLTTRQDHYTLTADNPLGPFNISSGEIRALFDTLVAIETSFMISGQDFTGSLRVHYTWLITMSYDFTPRGGRVLLTINSEVISKGGTDHAFVLFWKRAVWIDLFIFILAITSLVLTFRAIMKAVKSSKAIQKQRDQELLNRNNGSFENPKETKIRIFRLWWMITLIGNTCNLIGSVMNAGSQLGLVRPGIFVALVNGLGCAFAWFNGLRYMESFQSYYLLIIALRKGLPGVSRLLLSAMPLFLGYAMFGMIVFAELSNNFDTFDHALAALFSTLNGDSLYARFIAICEGNSTYAVIARLYEYSFVCLLCYAVVNIFIAIIQESYSKMRHEQEAKQPVAEQAKEVTQSENHGNEVPKGLYNELLAALKASQQEIQQLESQLSSTSERLKRIEGLLNRTTVEVINSQLD